MDPDESKALFPFRYCATVLALVDKLTAARSLQQPPASGRVVIGTPLHHDPFFQPIEKKKNANLAARLLAGRRRRWRQEGSSLVFLFDPRTYLELASAGYGHGTHTLIQHFIAPPNFAELRMSYRLQLKTWHDEKPND
jgi:hypothetical protein